MPCYSIWELLSFPPEVLKERLRTMTFQEREAERLEALRKTQAAVAQQKEQTERENK